MIKIPYQKQLYAFVILMLLDIAGYTQTNLMPVTHYVFPEFTKGIVLMKDGTENEASLNYNSLTSEMIFDTRGTKLALSQLETIDTVFIGNRKFVPKENSFIELLFKSKYSLFVEYKSKMKDPGKPAGYGTTSQTSAITTYSKYFSNGRVYDMQLPEGFETQASVVYWLDKDGKMDKFLSIHQLSKMFKEKENVFKSFTKKNDVDYDDQKSIIELIRYMDAN
jgi:hypothetical protein